MQTNECSVIAEVPETINLSLAEDRKKLDDLGKDIALKEKLHYEGYIAFTDVPYSVDKAKTTLCFD
ncbi:MAG: hypothetical protein ABID35_03860 [Candidatus Margulisiibacteriota bacterium]